MNGLTQWNPFRDLDDLEKRMSSMFGRRPVRSDDPQEQITTPQWAPLVDIVENENEFLIKADLPEVDKKNVKVRVDNGILTISGERMAEKEEKGKKLHRIERAYGSFTRSFTLPDGVDETRVAADFKDGLLMVHLPKDEKAKPRSIEVNVS
jgi:HSP20 family protein